MATDFTEFAGKVVELSDPQIHGMKAEEAKEATYQAAYRSCMRRKELLNVRARTSTSPTDHGRRKWLHMENPDSRGLVNEARDYRQG